MSLNISSSTISISVLHDKYQNECFAFTYCIDGLAYITLRFLITSFIVTIAKYVDITTMHGTKNIVRKNIILDNIK